MQGFTKTTFGNCTPFFLGGFYSVTSEVDARDDVVAAVRIVPNLNFGNFVWLIETTGLGPRQSKGSLICKLHRNS